MKRLSFFSQFENSPYFTKESLLVSADRLSIPTTTINTYIQRSIKNKEILSLKRNFYTTKKYFDAHKSNLMYSYMVGNKLVEPSYISMESALSYYGILTEGISSVITSVTPKATRKFTNRIGIFHYKSIKAQLFNGFIILNKEFKISIASPYKAIFDYLYYRIPIDTLRNKTKLINATEEYRLDIGILDKIERHALFELIKSI
ncbi:hypothetical protein JW962_02895 [Candidatus Dojkabacteria bacterium]|nr:hypothetical protein [Candidatus Dojkabacteria bacterium]